MKHLTHKEVQMLAGRLAITVRNVMSDIMGGSEQPFNVYPIPRGGIPAAYALLPYLSGIARIVDTPEQADVFIDDIVDSGRTMDKFTTQYNKPFFALIDKVNDKSLLGEYKDWIVFPWEGNEHASIEDTITRLLQFVGEDATREGLLETPRRVAKAWQHWCSGYSKNAKDILKVFEDGAENYNQMVTVRDIPIYSHCEHHLAAIIGTCTISYIPNGKIVGLSKLSRLADMFARRLQVQERLTQQIGEALWENLSPLGVGISIKARHLCMESRGVCQQGHHTVTTALFGVMETDAQARSEFLMLT